MPKELREAAALYHTTPEAIVDLLKRGIIRVDETDLARHFGGEGATVERTELKGAPYKIYHYLVENINAGRHPSYSDMARETRYSHVTVWRALKQLKEHGFIDTTLDGQRNVYTILK